jgi:hypothetical protein
MSVELLACEVGMTDLHVFINDEKSCQWNVYLR